MMISSNKGIYQLSLSTLKMMNLSDVHSPSWGVSFDYGREQFYWAGSDKGTTIHRSNLKSSNLETAQEWRPPVTGLAYDWIADNIYYANELEVGVYPSSGGNFLWQLPWPHCSHLFPCPRKRSDRGRAPSQIPFCHWLGSSSRLGSSLQGAGYANIKVRESALTRPKLWAICGRHGDKRLMWSQSWDHAIPIHLLYWMN